MIHALVRVSIDRRSEKKIELASKMHGVFKSYLSKYAMVQMQATVSALYE